MMIDEDKEAEMVKVAEEAARQEYVRKAEKLSGVFTKEVHEGYQEMMYINTVFSKEKALDLLIEDVHPNIKVKQGEKKILRYLSKVFVEELTEFALEAKQALGRKELDREAVDEGFRRYCAVHPLKKNQGQHLFK